MKNSRVIKSNNQLSKLMKWIEQTIFAMRRVSTQKFYILNYGYHFQTKLLKALQD